MKCKVCGKRFKLQADKRYEVSKKSDGFAGVFSGKRIVCYECFDCPKCGCQNVVHIREKNIIEADKAESEENDDIEAMLEHLWNDTVEDMSHD